MNRKIVDCIIFAMLKEERTLFLKNNNCFLYDETFKDEEILEFSFFDKNNRIRKGVFCSSDREMGNNEAGRLFYKVSRKYQSELCINLGVVGYIDEVNIGDVVIVDECYSLCEKNVANYPYQKTDANIDKEFIRKKVAGPLLRIYGEKFSDNSSNKLVNLNKNLDKYTNSHKIEDSVKESLHETCKHSENIIKLGSCATFHSVVKDEDTRNKIKAVRKTNIVDMEAYYFNDWHKLIRMEEYDEVLKDSKMIFFKSISDTAINEEKKILEEIGSRSVAMSNIYDVVTFYISNIYDFSNESELTLIEYFNEHISKNHINKLISYNPEAYQALEQLCPYIIINNSINGTNFNGDYISTISSILKEKKRILVLEGNPGKGKSTFISYIYQKVIEDCPAIFISIPELLKSNGLLSSKQSLFLLERLLTENENIAVFVDGVEGSRHKKSEDNKKILKELISILEKSGNRNVSLCIGAWHTNDSNDIKNDILNKINKNCEENTLTFKSVSALDPLIDDFIVKFANFYKFNNDDFDENLYVKKVKYIVNNNNIKLRYVDFRLLHIFARYIPALKNSSNIFQFIDAYCISKSSGDLDDVMDDVSKVFINSIPTDRFGLLTKNIYSRAFLLAKYIYNAFVNNSKEQITSIITNKYILSDNINLFLEYLLNSNINNAKVFFDNVVSYLKNEPAIRICSKIQLIYNISSIKNLSGNKRDDIMNYILYEMNLISNCNLSKQESDIIIAYRTLAIILNNKFGVSKYLESFNSFLLDEKDNNDFLRKINRNFHLLYYSQMEFTYDKVEDDVSFELEVIWNTYQILKNSIYSAQYKKEYIKTCAITLYQLVEYIKYESIPFDSFSEKDIEECKKLIEDK